MIRMLKMEAEDGRYMSMASRTRFSSDQLRAPLSPSRTRSVPRAGRRNQESPHKGYRAQRLEEVFNAFDLDSNGTISRGELLRLGSARRRLGQRSGEWNEEKNSALVAKMDKNGDGRIDRDEFVRHFETVSHIATLTQS